MPGKGENEVPMERREAREAGSGHSRQHSAGISAAGIDALLPKSSHTRSDSEVSADSSATFVVHVLPDHVPDSEVKEGSNSFTDSDTVPFRSAPVGMGDDWEGQYQRIRHFSGMTFDYVRMRAVQELNLLSRQWRMYVTVVHDRETYM